MFNRLASFKGQPDTFSLTLGYVPAIEIDAAEPIVGASGGALNKDSVQVNWFSSESESEILQKITTAAKDPEVVEERVAVQLTPPEKSQAFWGVVSAASAHHDVQLGLEIKATRPPLQSIELVRDVNGTISTSLGMSIWSTLHLQHVTRLRCNEGIGSLWDRSLLEKFSSLRVLNLSHANLSTLPGVIGTLTSLQELRLAGNQLKILPAEIGKLENLRVLAVDSNELSILPGELRKCAALEEFTLEHNRLTSVLLSFGSLRRLRTLHISGNPLEFLPEIAPCQELRSLSVANLRVSADQEFKIFNVELQAVTGPSSSHLAEDPKNRDLMAKQENALQQLILMALNDDDIVVEQTCKTLSLLAKHTTELANAILDTDAGSLKGLLKSDQPVKQQASLDLMAAISQSLGDVPNRLLTADTIEIILNIINDGDNNSQDLRTAALKCLGNLAFSSAGKLQLSSNPRVMSTILHLAEGTAAPGMNTVTVNIENIDNSGTPNIPPKRTLQAVPLRIKAAAVRALAILGDVSGVSRAVGRPLPQGRGLRILSMDGGGMKGMATVRLLRQLELRTGRPIHSLFDLIVGTSTGGLLAVALGLRKFSMNEAEKIYKVLGQKVFSRPNLNKEKDESWMEAFYRTFHSKTQHVRAVVVGYKHDAAVYETLLKEYCSFAQDPRCPSDALIDTACLDVPKIALVSTLASTSPAMPFVFRNYELPVALSGDREKMCYHKGSSNHAVWQAVRASSAAIYYLDDFTCGGDKFQDGAVVANNPSVIALQEARALWPDAPIDVFVSIGTGSTPQSRRDRAMSAFMDTGNILIESATNVERAHEALATMTPLIPSLKYFRFNPVDPRCSMELDEIDPLKWALLDEATDEFIEENSAEFDAVAAALLKSDSGGGGLGGKGAAGVVPGLPGDGNGVLSSLLPKRVLGLHRGLAVFTSIPIGADSSDQELAAKACARLKYCSVSVDLQSYEKPRGAETGGTKKQGDVVVSSAATTSTPLPKSKAPASPAANKVLPAPAVEPVSSQLQQPSSNVVEVDLGSALDSVFSWFSPSKLPAVEKEGEPASTTAATTAPPSPAVVAFEPTEAATPSPPAGDDRISPSPISHPIAFSPSPLPAKSKASRRRPGATTEASGGASNSGRVGGIATVFDEIDPLSVLQHSIENALSPVGIVHLALRVCPSGFVLRWNDSFAAVTVPSPEAEAIVRGAGYDPCSVSLPIVFEHCGGEVTLLYSNNITVRAVSTVYCGNVSVILVQYSSPAVLLDANAIEDKMQSVLAGKIVVCSEVVPSSCLTAFSAAGTLAVIFPEEAHTATGNCRSLSAFWARFYSELQSGTDLARALKRAEESEPVLEGAFKIC
ncbi:hypothetical protein KSW81_005044 [Nannochloris sp. 'desiccata']|nr:hypothetical protein KSW81_005044 [Chlorella desiccata (nom. nud.)]